MKDGEVKADTMLDHADKAVRYLLDRIQRDVNLRHYMLHTEAMRLLCEAEAVRLCVPTETVEQARAVWLGAKSSIPDVIRYRQMLEDVGIDWAQEQ